jgi:hypothetical protein
LSNNGTASGDSGREAWTRLLDQAGTLALDEPTRWRARIILEWSDGGAGGGQPEADAFAQGAARMAAADPDLARLADRSGCSPLLTRGIPTTGPV